MLYLDVAIEKFSKQKYVSLEISEVLQYFKPKFYFLVKMSSDKEKPASHFHGPRNEEFHKLGMFERVFGDFENTASPYSRFAKNVLGGLFVAPVVWFHENVVEKFRGEEYPYYHRRYRRVPTIDECYFHDHACQ